MLPSPAVTEGRAPQARPSFTSTWGMIISLKQFADALLGRTSVRIAAVMSAMAKDHAAL